jgi:uncharacterized damage-inducible protein DinB
MTERSLEKLFEHNNWANRQIIQVCSTLSDEHLDAEPQSATQGSIRSTLFHLVNAQRGYLRLLTRPLEERLEPIPTPPFAELEKLADSSGEGLLALSQEAGGNQIKGPIRSRDGYFLEPWVIMVQVINHATEHREQIKSMLSALEVTPPEIDGWAYGEAAEGVVPIGDENKDPS